MAPRHRLFIFRPCRIPTPMQAYVHFNISDHDRLPARFFGDLANVLSRS